MVKVTSRGGGGGGGDAETMLATPLDQKCCFVLVLHSCYACALRCRLDIAGDVIYITPQL